MLNNILIKAKKIWKEHGEQIITGLIVVGASAGAYALGCYVGNLDKGKDVGGQFDTIYYKENSCSEKLLESIEKTAKEVKVPDYIRNLPMGYHPSPEKIAEAIEKGVELGENQTLVDAHNKTYFV